MPFPVFHQAILIGKHQAAGVGRTLAEIGAWLAENGVEVSVERQTAHHCDLPGYADLSLDEVDGKVVGTLGVIGPTRMAYDRMIQIVDITAKLVGNALSQR